MNSSRESMPENGDKAKDVKHVLQRKSDILPEGSSAAPSEEIARDRSSHSLPIFGPAYQAWVRSRIEKHIVKAEKYASAHDFTSALHVITLAYIMNPLDEGVRMCELRILAMQQRLKARGPIVSPLVTGDKKVTAAAAEGDDIVAMRVSEHIAEADRLRAAHQFPEALDEIAKALTLDPSNELLAHYEKKIQESSIHAQHEAQQKVRHAKELCGNQRYKEALLEITQGLVVEPHSAELQTLEKEILKEHPELVAERPQNRAEDIRDHVPGHLGAAEELRNAGKFSEALDEICKAYAIDPTNEEIKKADERIREGEARLNQPRGLLFTIAFRNRRTQGGRLNTGKASTELVHPPVTLDDVMTFVTAADYPRALEGVKALRATAPRNIYLIAAERQVKRLFDFNQRRLLDTDLKEEIIHLLRALLLRTDLQTAPMPPIDQGSADKKNAGSPERAAALQNLKEQYFQYARESETKGDIERGLAELRRIVILDPHDAAAREYERRLRYVQKMSEQTLAAADSEMHEAPPQYLDSPPQSREIKHEERSARSRQNPYAPPAPGKSG